MPRNEIAQRKRARRFALQALYQWQFNERSTAEIIAEFLSRREMLGVDIEFFQKTVREVTKQFHALNQLMQPFLEPSAFRPQPVELAILLIGTYELKCELATPYRVVVSEAIELAKAFGATGSYRYVNGVLHAVATACRPNEIAIA